MKKNLPALRTQNLPGYEKLKKQVETALLKGQREIEWAKIQTYHETGKLIQKHILKNKDRADLGTRTVEKLAVDLDVSPNLLWYCVRFVRTIPVLHARAELPRNLTWTHFRELIAVPDGEIRDDLMRRASKGEWSSRELAAKIKEEGGSRTAPTLKGEVVPSKPHKLIGKLGKPYTKRVAKAEDHDGLCLDLGFDMTWDLPEDIKGLKAGDIVESEVKDKKKKREKWEYSYHASKRTESDLYTYKAFIKKVVDGDTIRVVIDCGFGMRIRQYLRLRGIDAPEMSTEAGKKVKQFVMKELEGQDHILIVTSRSDKYDRYLADVYYVPKNPNKKDKEFGHCTASLEKKESGKQYIPKGEKDYKFLNQFLLDTGRAVPMSF